MINTSTHASLVEIAHRARRSLEWVQNMARCGHIPSAVRTEDGWVVDRGVAEDLIREWAEID